LILSSNNSCLSLGGRICTKFVLYLSGYITDELKDEFSDLRNNSWARDIFQEMPLFQFLWAVRESYPEPLLPLRCATAQMSSTTRPFAQWNLILTPLQHSKFNIVYTGCFTIVETKRQLLRPLSMTLFIFLFPDCHREIVNLSIY